MSLIIQLLNYKLNRSDYCINLYLVQHPSKEPAVPVQQKLAVTGIPRSNQELVVQTLILVNYK